MQLSTAHHISIINLKLLADSLQNLALKSLRAETRKTIFWNIFYSNHNKQPGRPYGKNNLGKENGETKKRKRKREKYNEEKRRETGTREKKEKVYFRSQILECSNIGEYWNICGVPVFPKNVIITFLRTCWCYAEAQNTGAQNDLVLFNTRVPVSGTWIILSPRRRKGRKGKNWECRVTEKKMIKINYFIRSISICNDTNFASKNSPNCIRNKIPKSSSFWGSHISRRYPLCKRALGANAPPGAPLPTHTPYTHTLGLDTHLWMKITWTLRIITKTHFVVKHVKEELWRPLLKQACVIKTDVIYFNCC